MISRCCEDDLVVILDQYYACTSCNLPCQTKMRKHPMSEFEKAIEFVLHNEGGLNEDKRDYGGVTNRGISASFLRSFGDKYDFNKNGIIEDDIRALTIDQTKTIYHNEFWLPIYEEIRYQNICNYIFDMVISMSPAVAHKLVQRATWSATKQFNFLVDDGVFGQKTLSAINSSLALSLPFALMAERAGYYRGRVLQDPSQKVFIDGWLKRCYRFVT